MATKTAPNTADFNFNEKRKWQIALRRYVLEKNKSSQYAPYFGLPIDMFRKWIELQFDESLSWDNFSTAWQFDHIVPVALFDLREEEELKLCWSFINIRVENILHTKTKGSRVDMYETKRYFEKLHQKTLFPLCLVMIDKLIKLDVLELTASKQQQNFLLENKTYLQTVSTFGIYEFTQLNQGEKLEDVVEQKNQLKQFDNLGL
jgi:hypothetical protein